MARKTKTAPARAPYGTTAEKIVAAFRRKNGASAADLAAVTGWKHNPARWYAKKYAGPRGFDVVAVEGRKDGAVAYRLVKPAA